MYQQRQTVKCKKEQPIKIETQKRSEQCHVCYRHSFSQVLSVSKGFKKNCGSNPKKLFYMLSTQKSKALGSFIPILSCVNKYL